MRIARKFAWCLSMALIASFLFILPPSAARAQQRVSDKDMERMMKNLRYDTKSFRASFNNALGKSTIRKTSRAKDAKILVANFEGQTDAMLNRFKKNRNDGNGVISVVNTAGQVDSLLNSVSFGPDVMAKWQRIREELHPIAVGYGVQESYADPRDNGMASDDSASCLQSAGAVRANRLVSECLQVSPATHPPCNVQNSCALIVSEIRRSCATMGQGAPGFCGHYQ